MAELFLLLFVLFLSSLESTSTFVVRQCRAIRIGVVKYRPIIHDPVGIIQVTFTLPYCITETLDINPVFVLFHSPRILLVLSTLELLEPLGDLVGLKKGKLDVGPRPSSHDI